MNLCLCCWLTVVSIKNSKKNNLFIEQVSSLRHLEKSKNKSFFKNGFTKTTVTQDDPKPSGPLAKPGATSNKNCCWLYTGVHIQQSQQGGVCTVNSICRLSAGITGGHARSLVILERVVSETFHRSTCQCNLWGKWAVFFPSHPWVQISKLCPGCCTSLPAPSCATRL